MKNIFINGPITAAFIAERIQEHNNKPNIGGHSIFLGQVRADLVAGKPVMAIEYSANEPMAIQIMQSLRDDIFAGFPLSCMHVYHSLGIVKAGEISLFVFTSSVHRKAAIGACEQTVEKIKAGLPIWGKELFTDDSHQWKVNT